DASGAPFTQSTAERLAHYDHLVLLCGRYEGFDARVYDYVDEALSLGDYVLTGGELAAAVVLDATCRMLPGALGNELSSEEESHRRHRLEHRQFTRPNEFDGRTVPSVLLSGDHRRIARARQRDGLLRTAALRPDLFNTAPLSDEEREMLDDELVPSLAPGSSTSLTTTKNEGGDA
ncbi:MAG: hypothetical protein ACO3JL_11110, partial [Myxococcota bacterium]